ncbi:NlpE-like protein [Mucilaginibacter yixingensis]|uniref:NlpE-like protein n=1 Tax=Mucilaginibacter yixingensis TaxID=1295612 RepID=A0A2T5JDH7_9SPHI|nr:hypothetical protein [Mucilaginibacter yixingensis]PTQ99821.1 NlpE-like protein [Mucilaginibacter yixingensis]
MNNTLTKILLLLAAVAIIAGCGEGKKKEQKKQPVIYRGLYSFGPEAKTFKDYISGHEYWVIDSSAKLELSYSQLNFEKPYTPVYVEIEGSKIKSGKDAQDAGIDSTIIVKKLVKITKEIPPGVASKWSGRAKAESTKR